MNLRHATRIELTVPVWHGIEPHERDATNISCWTFEAWRVRELEWMPPHQRVIATMTDDHGRELRLTPHELAINGARNG